MSTVSRERRRVVRALAALFGAGAAALAGVPVLGAVLSPLLRRQAGEAAGGLIDAGEVDDLLEGVPRRVELVSTVRDGWTTATGVVGAAWLLKQKGGQVVALSSVCPHSGCSIKLESKDTFTCPCHDSSFSLEGRPLKGPSPRDMDPLDVEVRDGKVKVRWTRFKVGVKGREPV